MSIHDSADRVAWLEKCLDERRAQKDEAMRRAERAEAMCERLEGALKRIRFRAAGRFDGGNGQRCADIEVECDNEIAAYAAMKGTP